MGLIIQRFLQCDFCSETAIDAYHPSLNTSRKIRASLKRSGWTFENGKDKCEDCNKKIKHS